MELDDVQSDLIALRKLYGLLETNGDGMQCTTIAKSLDDKSRSLLKSLLDGAVAKVFETHSKVIAARVNLPNTPTQPQLSNSIPSSCPHVSSNISKTSHNVSENRIKKSNPSTSFRKIDQISSARQDIISELSKHSIVTNKPSMGRKFHDQNSSMNLNSTQEVEAKMHGVNKYISSLDRELSSQFGSVNLKTDGSVKGYEKNVLKRISKTQQSPSIVGSFILSSNNPETAALKSVVASDKSRFSRDNPADVHVSNAAESPRETSNRTLQTVNHASTQKHCQKCGKKKASIVQDDRNLYSGYNTVRGTIQRTSKESITHETCESRKQVEPCDSVSESSRGSRTSSDWSSEQTSTSDSEAYSRSTHKNSRESDGESESTTESEVSGKMNKLESRGVTKKASTNGIRRFKDKLALIFHHHHHHHHHHQSNHKDNADVIDGYIAPLHKDVEFLGKVKDEELYEEQAVEDFKKSAVGKTGHRPHNGQMNGLVGELVRHVRKPNKSKPSKSKHRSLEKKSHWWQIGPGRVKLNSKGKPRIKLGLKKKKHLTLHEK